jgi:hypothetical protein
MNNKMLHTSFIFTLFHEKEFLYSTQTQKEQNEIIIQASVKTIFEKCILTIFLREFRVVLLCL